MKYEQKGNKIIVKNECTSKFKRELTILIKKIMESYNVKGQDKDYDKAFVSILNSNICVIVDNHFLDKDPIVDKWIKDCLFLKDMNSEEMNLLISNSVQSYKKGYDKSKQECKEDMIFLMATSESSLDEEDLERYELLRNKLFSKTNKE